MTAPKLAVTPCMGVWIETTKACDGSLQSASHPVWVCGLKQVVRYGKAKEQTVTPCMGVWIETGGEVWKSKGANSHTLYGCVD